METIVTAVVRYLPAAMLLAGFVTFILGLRLGAHKKRVVPRRVVFDLPPYGIAALLNPNSYLPAGERLLPWFVGVLWIFIIVSVVNAIVMFGFR